LLPAIRSNRWFHSQIFSRRDEPRGSKELWRVEIPLKRSRESYGG
jgi:hypothetical protein